MPIIIQNRKKVCCVRECKSLCYHFYNFPHNLELKNEWKNILQINTNINNNHLVCSNHFKDHNFFGIKKMLKKKAKPDKNLPTVLKEKNVKITNATLSPMKKESNELKNERLEIQERNDNKLKCNQIINVIKENNFQNREKSNSNEISERSSSPDFHGFSIKNSINHNTVDDTILENNIEYSSGINCENKEAFLTKQNEKFDQVDQLLFQNDISRHHTPYLNNKIKYFYNVLSTPAEQECWTGIKNGQIFKNLITKIREYESKNLSHRTEYMNSIPLEELLTIVMVRIRTNLNFLRMSTIFNMSEEEITNRFEIFLPIFRLALTTNKNWPSKRLGKSFCLILEPFEFFIENTKLQENTIVKVLIGFDKSGNMIWKSNIYLESTSYHDICITENVYDKLRRIDMVVVSKNVGVHYEFKKREIFCSVKEDIIEQKIKRIRENIRIQINSFEIFQQPIDYSMLRHLDNILSIVCFIINMK